MSRSSPGRYALHEFAKNIYLVRASDGAGHVLPMTHPDPYGWTVPGQHGTVVIEYTVYGDRVDGTYAAIDETHAHLNLPAMLVWARGFEMAPSSLRFQVPPEWHWQVASELAHESDGSWSAPNLEQLMDSPVELSAHVIREWNVGSSAFRLALHHRGSDDEARIFADMCKAVVTEEEGVFGSFPKYDTGSYTFLVDYLPWASRDGMEHRDATVITGAQDLKTSSEHAIATVSHEFFHSWNVRRIRPRSLEPFDFERADMSGELWFAEGFTNYYGSLVLARAGLASLDSFAREMGEAVNEVLTAPGRKVHNVVEMSELAPFVDAATSVDPTNLRNIFISYYTYGQALALGIDLAIRTRFPGKSLDDWMRTMWHQHPDIDKPYTLEDLERTLAQTTGDAQFAQEIFRDHIYGKTPMAYGTLLRQAGLLLRKAQPGKAWLGATGMSFSDEGVELSGNTLRESPLYGADLDKGDKILRWKGKVIKSEEELELWLEKQNPGSQVELQVQTRGGEKKVKLVLKENPALEVVPYESGGETVTAAMKSFRNMWLGSKALYPLPHIDPMP